MRQALFLAAVVLLMSGTVLPDAAAEQQTLTGHVVDVSGEPLVQVEVTLEAYGAAPDRTFTDALGRFEFSDVAPGTYQIIVEPPGYERVRLTLKSHGVADMGSLRIVVNRLRFLEKQYRRPSGDYVVDVGQFLENFPDEAIDHYKKGLKAKETGQSQSAIQHLEETVRLAPRFFSGHLDLGVLYHHSGRLDDAQHEYWLARCLNHHRAEPLVNLGGIYIARGEFDRAIDVLR